MDINSLIANYLKNTSNTEISASQIKDTFYNLANEDLQFYDSIFVYGEDATKDELIEYMSKACGKDDEQFKEDVGLLFDVLNSNSTDDVLTGEELENFNRKMGDNRGKIDGFSFWNQLLSSNVDEIEAELADLDTSEKVDAILKSNDIDAQLSIYADAYGEDSEKFKEIAEQVTIKREEISEKENFTQDSINRLAQSIIDGKYTLEDVRESLELSDEDFAKLEDVVKTLQESGEISSEENATKSDEITSDVTKSDEITSDVTKSDVVVTEAKIPDDVAKIYAKELQNGIESCSPEKIREYLDLDSADLVKVLSVYTYNEGYGSITKAIESGYSEFSIKEEFINTIMYACIEQAKNGNEEAIGILCNELYSATAQTWGYTGYTVLDSFFNNAGNEVINLVKDNYSKYVEGHELRDDINGEAMWFHQDNKTSYISKIDKSWQEET